MSLIAREIHDSLAQVLGYVNTKAQAVQELLKRGQTERAEAQVGQFGDTARAAYADVREGIHVWWFAYPWGCVQEPPPDAGALEPSAGARPVARHRPTAKTTNETTPSVPPSATIAAQPGV
jgi:Histidine kinase